MANIVLVSARSCRGMYGRQEHLCGCLLAKRVLEGSKCEDLTAKGKTVGLRVAAVDNDVPAVGISVTCVPASKGHGEPSRAFGCGRGAFDIGVCSNLRFLGKAGYVIPSIGCDVDRTHPCANIQTSGGCTYVSLFALVISDQQSAFVTMANGCSLNRTYDGDKSVDSAILVLDHSAEFIATHARNRLPSSSLCCLHGKIMSALSTDEDASTCIPRSDKPGQIRRSRAILTILHASLRGERMRMAKMEAIASCQVPTEVLAWVLCEQPNMACSALLQLSTCRPDKVLEVDLADLGTAFLQRSYSRHRRVS
nr:hypothetical protein CFP56_09382 [Quercus suber]